MKKTIFAADDNTLTLEALRTSDIWEKCGYELIGTAASGTAAYEQIRRLKPDVAVLDIRMPGMSGLEVIKKLEGEECESLFVILTAYDDFSFAKEAIKLGSFDYLLKPLDEKEISTVLAKAADVIDEKRMQNALLSRLEREEQVAMILDDSLKGSANALERLCRLPAVTEAAAFGSMLFQDLTSKSEPKTLDLDRYLRQALDYAEELEEQYHVRILHAWNRWQLYLLVCYPENLSEEEYHSHSMTLAEFIWDKMTEAGLHCAAGISDCKVSARELPDMLKETKIAVNRHFYWESKPVISYNTSESNEGNREKGLGGILYHVFGALRKRDPQAIELVRTLMEQIERDQREEDIVKSIALQIVMETYYSGMETTQRSGIEADTEADDIYASVQRQENIRDLRQWLESYLESELGSAQNDNTEKAEGTEEKENHNYSRPTRLALEYISAHYMEHIGLTDVSNYAEVSESHLCRVLKNDLGDTFVSLLNKERIQAAIRLLEDGHHKVYEIADLVGFSNYAYFYQLFRKITGCPPTEYYKGEK